MSIKFRTWKYENPKKTFISSKKLHHWVVKDLCLVYDTRNKLDFQKLHIKNSKNVSSIIIKGTILKHEIIRKIILVGPNLRTNAIIASWARYKGYKKIYLISQPLSQLPKDILAKTKKKN